MNQKSILKEILGVNVAEYGVIDLTLDAFIGLDLEQYPEAMGHFIVYAVQFQQPIPSMKSMEKALIKNKKKIAQKNNISVRPKKIKAKTAKKGSKAVSRKRMPKLLASSSVSSQLQSKLIGGRRAKSSAIITFVAKSPQQVALKAARTICLEMLKNSWKKQEMKDENDEEKEQSKSAAEPKPQKPLYFRKKKASQKRRRQQRRNLLTKNKQRLVEIYGNQILDNCSRIGIKQIRKALEMKQEQVHVQLGGSFMDMVDQKDQ